MIFKMIEEDSDLVETLETFMFVGAYIRGGIMFDCFKALKIIQPEIIKEWKEWEDLGELDKDTPNSYDYDAAQDVFMADNNPELVVVDSDTDKPIGYWNLIYDEMGSGHKDEDEEGCRFGIVLFEKLSIEDVVETLDYVKKTFEKIGIPNSVELRLDTVYTRYDKNDIVDGHALSELPKADVEVLIKPNYVHVPSDQKETNL